MVNWPQRRIVHGIGWLALAAAGGAGVVLSIWMSLTRGFIAQFLLVPLVAATLPLAVYLVAAHEGKLGRGHRFVVGAIFLTASVVLTDWPFRAALRLSRPALRRTAHATDSGAPPASSLGWLPIQRVEEQPGVTAYWTDLQPSGYSGLVYSPSGDLPFNVGYANDLGDGWYFLFVD